MLIHTKAYCVTSYQLHSITTISLPWTLSNFSSGPFTHCATDRRKQRIDSKYASMSIYMSKSTHSQNSYLIVRLYGEYRVRVQVLRLSEIYVGTLNDGRVLM